MVLSSSASARAGGGGLREPISAVIVTYESGDVIAACLDALRDIDDIVVVDNASSDGTGGAVESGYPGVRLIANKTNRGFAAAVNQGFEPRKRT